MFRKVAFLIFSFSDPGKSNLSGRYIVWGQLSLLWSVRKCPASSFSVATLFRLTLYTHHYTEKVAMGKIFHPPHRLCVGIFSLGHWLEKQTHHNMCKTQLPPRKQEHCFCESWTIQERYHISLLWTVATKWEHWLKFYVRTPPLTRLGKPNS